MEASFKALQVIWLALIGGLLAFSTVTFCILTFGVAEMPGLPPAVLRFAAPAIVIAMASALLLRRRMVDAIPASARGLERFQKYQTAVITSLALVDACSLFLVVLAMVSNAPTWIPPSAAAGLLIMFLARPRREEAGPDF